MCRSNLLTLFLAVLMVFAQSKAQGAYTINVVGVYDENTSRTNTVDFSATSTVGNEISLTDFSSLVNQAYASGLGGVMNFDTGSVSVKPSITNPTDYLTAKYGLSFEKSVNITNGSVTEFLSSSDTSNRTPISGNRYLSKSGTPPAGVDLGSAGGNFIFDFSASDQVVAIGGTLLSRSDVGGNATGKVSFSDGTFAQVVFNQGTSNGLHDVFWGFRATDSQQALGIYITQFALLLTPNHYRGFDDLAFVVAPEPSKSLLLLGGALTLCLRRRRVA